MVYATLITGVPSELVRKVFAVFLDLGYPTFKGLIPFPWDEDREPYLQQNQSIQVSAEANTLLQRILSLVDNVRFIVGQYVSQETFFEGLGSIAPDWLELGEKEVIIRDHVFGGTEAADFIDVAREVQWSWRRGGYGEIALVLSKKAFFKRYVENRAWPVALSLREMKD